jgi:uncharacterized protein YggE
VDTGILVTGVGEVRAAPDVLRVRLTVACDRTDVSGALSAVAERAGHVMAALREFGLDDRQLQTSAVAVHPRYGREDIVVGYRASNGLVATCSDLTAGGQLLTAAAAAGGNDLSVDRITMEIADPAPLMAQAREQAFADARDRAEAFATMSGRPLGPMEFLEEHDGQGAYVPTPRGALLAGSSVESSMPMEAGEHAVRAYVTVRWGLAPVRRP